MLGGLPSIRTLSHSLYKSNLLASLEFNSNYFKIFLTGYYFNNNNNTVFFYITFTTMASIFKGLVILALLSLVLKEGGAHAQLSTNFYSRACPKLLPTVRSAMQSAIRREARMGASILRLFFHDCFVNVIILRLISL